jgi:hypothetical protein
MEDNLQNEMGGLNIRTTEDIVNSHWDKLGSNDKRYTPYRVTIKLADVKPIYYYIRAGDGEVALIRALGLFKHFELKQRMTSIADYCYGDTVPHAVAERISDEEYLNEWRTVRKCSHIAPSSDNNNPMWFTYIGDRPDNAKAEKSDFSHLFVPDYKIIQP